MSTDPATEASRRRTFAIISHPDAGKTTLTEKFLLYGGALANEAGAVKARSGRRSATSDWMALEQQRGISITSTVLQFPYLTEARPDDEPSVINLLDTPGHRDFSEDTYRVLAAADAAVMVLDAAKGIEPQTLKLFDVCRQRGMPLLTFINKWDRPGRGAARADRRDRADSSGIVPTPVTWPVGIAGDFRGVLDRRDRRLHPLHPHRPRRHRWRPRSSSTSTGPRPRRARPATPPSDEIGPARRGRRRPRPQVVPRRRVHAGVLRQRRSPTSACASCSTPSSTSCRRPRPRPDIDGEPRPLDAPFSGFVFKVQANMDPSHRDRIAFMRVCSGHFERGMVVTHGRTGKPFATKYAHSVFGQERETIEEAYPGDVVGLVNATDVRIGDALYVDEPVEFPPIPTFAPEIFSVARVKDTSKAKQFRKGIAQLDEEGVVQVLRERDQGESAPILAAVGPMQFEVAVHRLENEFGAPVELTPTSYRVARRTDEASAEQLPGHARRAHRRAGRRHRCSPCSRAPTGSTASSRSTPTSCSTAWSPRAAQG